MVDWWLCCRSMYVLLQNLTENSFRQQEKKPADVRVVVGAQSRHRHRSVGSVPGFKAG